MNQLFSYFVLGLLFITSIAYAAGNEDLISKSPQVIKDLIMKNLPNADKMALRQSNHANYRDGKETQIEALVAQVSETHGHLNHLGADTESLIYLAKARLSEKIAYLDRHFNANPVVTYRHQIQSQFAAHEKKYAIAQIKAYVEQLPPEVKNNALRAAIDTADLGLIRRLVQIGVPLTIDASPEQLASYLVSSEAPSEVYVFLSQLGFDFKKEGRVALAYAATENNVDAIHSLIDQGVDPNDPTHPFTGERPVHAVIRDWSPGKDLRGLQALVDRGADINITAKRQFGTVVHEASFYQRDPQALSELLTVLVKDFHADLNAKDGNGNTIAHQIASDPDQGARVSFIFPVLQALGANLNQRRGNIPFLGQRPIDLARKKGRVESIAVLESLTANSNRAVNPSASAPVSASADPSHDLSSAHH